MFKNILVIGSGTMGLGATCIYALQGFNVTLAVRNANSIPKIVDELNSGISRIIRRVKSEEKLEKVIKNVLVVSSVNLENKFDFVFEAVSEDIQVKKSVMSSFDHAVTEETIWATNTSSLSVTDMAAHYIYPDRFIGLHFFNPVSNMELVEIIPSMLTAKTTFDACWEFCLKLGKKPVRVEDSPGFIVNRLLIPMINEAIGILENNVASIDEIDSAMKLGAHHPLGPLALADLIGNDVCLSIMNALYTATCDSKYRPSHLLKKMVSANKLGRKTGQGFYSY